MLRSRKTFLDPERLFETSVTERKERRVVESGARAVESGAKSGVPSGVAERCRNLYLLRAEKGCRETDTKRDACVVNGGKVQIDALCRNHGSWRKIADFRRK